MIIIEGCNIDRRANPNYRLDKDRRYSFRSFTLLNQEPATVIPEISPRALLAKAMATFNK